MPDATTLPIVVSPDTARANRVPPGQVKTRKYTEYTAHERPDFDPATWRFTVDADFLETPAISWTWAEFSSLPRIRVKADFHCVTRWSVLENLWEGVPTRELLAHIRPSERAKFVMVGCSCGYTTNLPVSEFFGEDCLFALKLDGEALPLPMGYPMRLIVPRLYAWKSAKWANSLTFMEIDSPGFWEEWRHGGYHMLGDPWTEQRHRGGYGGAMGDML